MPKIPQAVVTVGEFGIQGKLSLRADADAEQRRGASEQPPHLDCREGRFDDLNRELGTSDPRGLCRGEHPGRGRANLSELKEGGIRRASPPGVELEITVGPEPP